MLHITFNAKCAKIAIRGIPIIIIIKKKKKKKKKKKTSIYYNSYKLVASSDNINLEASQTVYFSKTYII